MVPRLGHAHRHGTRVQLEPCARLAKRERADRLALLEPVHDLAVGGQLVHDERHLHLAVRARRDLHRHRFAVGPDQCRGRRHRLGVELIAHPFVAPRVMEAVGEHERVPRRVRSRCPGHQRPYQRGSFHGCSSFSVPRNRPARPCVGAVVSSRGQVFTIEFSADTPRSPNAVKIQF